MVSQCGGAERQHVCGRKESGRIGGDGEERIQVVHQ